MNQPSDMLIPTISQNARKALWIIRDSACEGNTITGTEIRRLMGVQYSDMESALAELIEHRLILVSGVPFGPSSGACKARPNPSQSQLIDTLKRTFAKP